SPAARPLLAPKSESCPALRAVSSDPSRRTAPCGLTWPASSPASRRPCRCPRQSRPTQPVPPRAGPARPWPKLSPSADDRLKPCPVWANHERTTRGDRRQVEVPTPATVETWVSDAIEDPLRVVMAEGAASLAAELRQPIPELPATVGDDPRVL